MTESRDQVVVVGGGFGGLQAARVLARADIDVTLIDRNNYHLFQPLSYQVATGSLSPGEIAVPLRQVFRHRPRVPRADMLLQGRGQHRRSASRHAGRVSHDRGDDHPRAASHGRVPASLFRL